MKNISLILFAIVPSIAFGTHLTVTFDSAQTLDSTQAYDVTDSGSWFINFNEGRWIKDTGADSFLLYPNKDDRTEVAISSQAAVESNLATFIKEGIQNGFYSIEGEGLDLEEIDSLDVSAASIDDGNFCNIFVRQGGKEFMLKIFEDANDETVSATTAKNNVLTELGNISTASDAGGFFKVR